MENIISWHKRPAIPPTSNFNLRLLFQKTHTHTHTHTYAYTSVFVCGHLIACTLLVYNRSHRDEFPSATKACMWWSIYLTAVLSPECYISSAPLSIVFRRGSGSTGLPRIRISHKAEQRATVTLSDLWRRGDEREASQLIAGWENTSSEPFEK